jgi:hypothetical protein
MLYALGKVYDVNGKGGRETACTKYEYYKQSASTRWQSGIATMEDVDSCRSLLCMLCSELTPC